MLSMDWRETLWKHTKENMEANRAKAAKGGKARARNLSPEARSMIARLGGICKVFHGNRTHENCVVCGKLGWEKGENGAPAKKRKAQNK